MTLLDRIHSADITELAEFLCKMYSRSCSCDDCPAEELCSYGNNGMLNWLKKTECREDVEISYLVE